MGELNESNLSDILFRKVRTLYGRAREECNKQNLKEDDLVLLFTFIPKDGVPVYKVQKIEGDPLKVLFEMGKPEKSLEKEFGLKIVKAEPFTEEVFDKILKSDLPEKTIKEELIFKLCPECRDKNSYKKLKKWFMYQKDGIFVALILSEVWECKRCGYEVFSENQMMKHAKLMDKYLK